MSENELPKRRDYEMNAEPGEYRVTGAEASLEVGRITEELRLLRQLMSSTRRGVIITIVLGVIAIALGVASLLKP